MTTETKANPAQTSTPEKPGLFKRLFEKLDRTMKAKAEEKSTDSCCCGPDSDKGQGGKCC